MAYIGNIPVPDSTEHRQEFTATASQTTFTTSGYANGFVDVYLNGVKLAAADFTANDNSTVVLTSGASAGDVLAVVARTQTTDGSAGFASTSEVQGTHTTGSITSGTTALTVASATGISTGDYVVGEGITPGTTVTAGGGTTSLTLSANAGATLSSDPVSFYKADKVLSPGLVGSQLCRAWVNFDGTGTVAIRASYNVASITDNATGDFTVNLTTAMPDSDYVVVAGCGSSTTRVGTFVETSVYTARTASAARIGPLNHAGTPHDPVYVDVAIFR
jgi:hypothetical protein